MSKAGSTSNERFYRRKLNEMEQDVKRLQKEIQKLKALRRGNNRARKQETRALQREMDLQEVFDDLQAEVFDNHARPEKQEKQEICRSCGSPNVHKVQAGVRLIVVCQECSRRYTIRVEDDKDERDGYAKLA